MKMPYPEPPHLDVALYPACPEAECFAALSAVLPRFGCQPDSLVEVAPWDATFLLRSDLVGRSRIISTTDDQFHQIVSGADVVAGRPVRAAYRRGSGEPVLLEYLAGAEGDRHPIAISTAANSLGLPTGLWQTADRESAMQLAAWATDFLRAATVECEAWYGAIGIEQGLPTPRELISGIRLPSQVYLSHAAVAHAPELLSVFENDFPNGRAVEWTTGRFFSNWAPFNAEEKTVRIPPVAASNSLGRVIMSLQ